VNAFRSAIERVHSLVPYVIIFFVITMTALPTLRSQDQLSRSVDYFQYAARHEMVRKSVVEYHTLPLRSHWVGGGYPTIGDPEDPTLNPLVVLSLVFGTVKGLKLIVYFALLTGGLATYALARSVLGYTRWGALFSGLAYGSCPFVPLRLVDGNTNEVYAAFLPLCLLLLGLACQGRKIAIPILTFVFYIMISDGKLTSLMTMFYIAVFCVLALIPSTSPLAPVAQERRSTRIDFCPLKVLLLATILTGLIGMVRILPAEELIHSHGGIRQMLATHPKTYAADRILAYTFEHLWTEAIGFEGRVGFMTIGWLPIFLSGIAFVVFWRKTLAWGITLLVFGWLSMAHHAPIDLLKLLWNLPVFEAIYRPDKYFSFQIVFTFAIVSGRCFSVFSQLQSRSGEALIAATLILSSVGFLYPKAENLHRRAFILDPTADDPRPATGFFQIDGALMSRSRRYPRRALTYFNVRQDIGTIDWYTGIPTDEHAVPKYFVDWENAYVPNAAYRGEAFFEAANAGSFTADPVFRPNSIVVSVKVNAPSTLIINQNFHRDWHTDRGQRLDRAGLLAIRLEETGDYIIHLRYYPRAFYAGLAVTISSFLALTCVCWAYKTGRLDRWARSGPRVLQKGSRAVLWSIN
jgi:hypothetical protein